jgi:hypothetical protein
MKRYIITESQNKILRRFSIFQELVDKGIENVINHEAEDFCMWNAYEFLVEISWQVSDNMKDVDSGDMSIKEIHDLISEHFWEYIMESYDDIVDLLCNKKSKYEDDIDDDEDYNSSLLYGVDNN